MAQVAKRPKPHVLILPFPAQGHVHPMLKLAQVISTAGLYVTFLSTEAIHDRLIRSELFQHLSGLSVRFRSLLDGLPVNDPHNSYDFLDFMDSLAARSKETYKEVLAPSGGDVDGWPWVSCVIADGLFLFALDVPKEMKIPVMLFRTSSACSVWMYYSIPKLIQRGKLPFSEDTDMDELAEVVEGMESFLRLRDLSGLLRSVKSVNDRLLRFLITCSNNLLRASALILNTVEHLEAMPLSCIRSICPIIYTIGPLQLLQKTYNSNLQSPSSTISLWQEDRSCMTWLDRQPHKSVVYVSFGSTTIVSRESLLEFWHGLVNGGYPFLLVIRPDMIKGGIDSKDVFSELPSEKGFLVEWAPQEEALAHPAVGCFITHSGWNSTLESIISGVPMICWPFFADQQVNSRFVGEVWKIGVDIKDTCERSIVEKMVRKVMDDGEEVEALRRRACEMMEVVKTSVEEGGSSYINFQKLIQHIISFSYL